MKLHVLVRWEVGVVLLLLLAGVEVCSEVTWEKLCDFPETTVTPDGDERLQQHTVT